MKLFVPCISDIVDLWPQSIVEYVGINARNPIIQILYQLEKFIYKNSNAIIFSMEGGRDYIKDRGWDKKINMAKKPKKVPISKRPGILNPTSNCKKESIPSELKIISTVLIYQMF